MCSLNAFTLPPLMVGKNYQILAENGSLLERIRSYPIGWWLPTYSFSSILISFELLNRNYIKFTYSPEMQCDTSVLQKPVFQLLSLSGKKCNLLKNRFISSCQSYLLAMFILPFSLVPTVFSISQPKILPRTDVRLLSSLLHNHLIYTFKHWDYNHLNNFLLSITIIFHLDVNEFNRETKTYEKSYIKVKKWMSMAPIFLSKNE